jgi:hypothetical protein
VAVKLVRIAFLCCVLLSLAACPVFQFLLGSVFPSTVTLLKAQVNLSSVITSDQADGFVIRVVRSAGKDYVCLSGVLGSQGNVMMFFDSDLNLLMTVPTSFTEGFGVFADSSGQVVGGNTLFGPGLAGSTLFTNIQVLPSATVGVDGFPVVDPTVTPSDVTILSQGTSSTLSYQVFTDPLAVGQTLGGTTPVLLSASGVSLQVRAVLNDGSLSGNVFVVLAEPSSNDSSRPTKSYFLTIPKTSFITPNVVAPNLVDTAPHRDGLDPNSFGYADGHLIAYDTTIASYVLIDPSSGTTVGSFYSHVDPAQVLFAYPASGGFFYTFDPDSIALSKYAKWW